MSTIAPYGSWVSIITTERLVEKTVGLSDVVVDGEDLYWSELRPSEGGRIALLRRTEDGEISEVVGEEFSVRTLVHEYGGLCVAARNGTVVFSNLADQRLYRVEAGTGTEPVPVTAAPALERAWRYAAPVIDAAGRLVYCVRERHFEPDVAETVVNEVVAVLLDGSGDQHVIAAGRDFYSHVTLSPDGRRLAWTEWDHPDMPWDATDLKEVELGDDGLCLDGAEPRLVAGGSEESVVQPTYSPDGHLHFSSDRSGWWNIYRAGNGGMAPVADEALAPMEADLGSPDWVFGISDYAFLPDGSIVAAFSSGGTSHLGRLWPGVSAFDDIPSTFSDLASVRGFGAGLVAIGGSETMAASVVVIDPDTGEATVVRASRETVLPPEHCSVATPIEFPTEGGLSAHALYYPPMNPSFEAPAGELPPLIVSSHGGPTAASRALLNYTIQYWTSRGFAVVDVNYGGSSGYGRAYRERLKGNWGVVDLDDCANAARYLGSKGLADPDRLLIHGGSAGGYTTLCALTFRDVFAAGASYFGVADLGALARETHKFESRYLDGMVGPWPDAEELYEERSPIFHTDQLRTPMILFQGLEDRVVPPNQAEAMAEALRSKGVPFAYIAYEGEQHGFRRAENIKRTAEAELSFYGQVLGFVPAGEIVPVPVENAAALPEAGRPAK